MKAAIIGMAALLSGAGAPDNAPPRSVSPAASDAIIKAELIDPHAPYPQAHASTIVQFADGSLMAAWFAGSGEGNADVRIWTSRNGGSGRADRWSTPAPVATGIGSDGRSLPTWNPVLFQPAPGDLRLFYKVGPNPRDWWGMMLRSTDNGRSWGKPERLPDGVLGPIKNKPVVLRDGSWLAPSSREEGTADANYWSLRMERSTDRGAHWTVEPPIASPMHIEAIQPSVLSYPDGRLELIARTRQGALAMSWSKDTGRTWSPLAAIDLPNPNAGTDAVTLRDGRQLIVYNHSGHWPDRPGDGPRWPLNLALSDDGVRWHPVLTLESKPLPDGYAYPAVIQTRDGLVRITYTYDRKHIKYVVVDPRRLR